MSVTIRVGPNLVTINQGSTYMVTDHAGQITFDSDQGLFANDTRFLGTYQLDTNGKPWIPVTASALQYLCATTYLKNESFRTSDGCDVPEGALILRLSRIAQRGIREELHITNHADHDVHFNLDLTLRSDFADVFELKARQFVRRRGIRTEWDSRKQELRHSYRRGDFSRELRYSIRSSTSSAVYANGMLVFDVDLRSHETWSACCDYVLIVEDDVRAPNLACGDAVERTDGARLRREWLAQTASMQCPHEAFSDLYRQSVEDLGALRLHDIDMPRDVWVPAAGVPWFMTLFGRDSLIAALQSLVVTPGLARGALLKLAQYQARETDHWRDAQPGKILHELRRGELAYFDAVPHTPYYGTADATPLYLILLHETWKWTGDERLLEAYRDTALGCLDWLDRYGDLDGDGFQEYRCRSPKGIDNQSWKDSDDAIVFPDGRRAAAPIATCELQGYAYDARMRMAEVFEALGEGVTASDLRARARALAERFEETFWCEDLDSYALALDGDKQPVASVASNAGHLLWCGMIRRDRAERVVRRFLQPDMWSGWGIRTLSADHRAFNPLSYQRGSVWPHDNGMIALGCRRYGMAADAGRIARGLIDASGNFARSQMPELFAGLPRLHEDSFPVPYPNANTPQAWAAGSAFHLIRALVGLEADAPHGVLYVDPVLPDWLPSLVLRGVPVGGARVDLRCRRDGDRTSWDAEVSRGESGSLDVRWREMTPWADTHPHLSSAAKENCSST